MGSAPLHPGMLLLLLSSLALAAARAPGPGKAATTTAGLPTTSDPSLRVELQGGDGQSYGNVFATNRDGIFGPVCDDGWSYNQAVVVCRQLGYDDGYSYLESHWGAVPDTFAMDSVSCSGDEQHLQDCSYETTDDCGTYEGAGVACIYGSTTPPPPTTTTSAPATTTTVSTTLYNYTVELQGGDGRSYGNVFATNRNGIFGPVCDDSWSYKEADVVCHQLGYDGGTPYTNSHWGDVPNLFAMDDVGCSGDEQYLQDCSYTTDEDCGSGEGAGVHCHYYADTTTTTTTAGAPTTTAACPLGWADDGVRGCYLFATQMTGRSWLEALEYCEEEGGFLAEPKTPEQLEFVSSVAYIEETHTGVQAWYVGLSDMGHEGEWVWQFDREDANITNWDVGCPDTSPTNSHDCAALVSISADRRLSAHYRDLSCFEAPDDLLTAPICQRSGLGEDTTSTTPPQTTTYPDCPSGWATFAMTGGKKCFQFFISSITPTNAETNCQSYNGHLASIHSEDEQTFVAQLASSTNSYVWIGGKINLGEWEWTDGTDFDFTFWLSDQPDGGQSFIGMDMDYSNGGWRDMDPDNYYPYICQLTL